MLNPIPFRRTGWIVSDRDGQPSFIRKLLQFLLPQPTAIAIRATPVSLDQQLGFTRIVPFSFLLPPSPNHIDRKLGSFMRRANPNETEVARHIIDPIGNRFAICIGEKIRRQNRQGLLPPGPARIFEIAHQLLFLRIDANCRLFGPQKFSAFASDIAHLSVAFSIVSFTESLAIDLQRVVQGFQQTPNRFVTCFEAFATQGFRQFARRFVRPLQTADGIAEGRILEQLLQNFQDFRPFFLSAMRPPPERRTLGLRSVRRTSARPTRMVVRLNPVISWARSRPPRPSCNANSPTKRRRLFSSNVATTRLIAVCCCAG